MIRYWILQGDPTSSGGIVVDATFNVHANPGDGGAKPVALIGGLATCGQCGSPGRILPAPPRVSWIPKFNGVDVALSGDYVACKCEQHPILINTSYKQLVSIHSEGVTVIQPPFQETHSNTNIVAASLQFNDRFQIIDEQTGKPAALQSYAILRESEDLEYGVTDENGYTHITSDETESEELSIYLEG